VLLLSARPCCGVKDCQQRISAEKTKGEKSTPPEKECPCCSPFFTCGSCVGFIVSKPVTLALPVTIENNTAYPVVYQQPDIEKVTLAIWLPPKIS
jgi:hypothetical protein